MKGLSLILSIMSSKTVSHIACLPGQIAIQSINILPFTRTEEFIFLNIHIQFIFLNYTLLFKVGGEGKLTFYSTKSSH